MKQRSLGQGALHEKAPSVSAIGLGCMGMSGMYGPASEEESLRTLGEALERGVSFLDTGDFYGMGHNELLIREAIKGRKRENIFISLKFGPLVSPNGQFIGIDTRPVALKNFVSYSLKRLGTDYIDLYQPARLDPKIPIEETVGGIAELIQAGYVRHLGLSEVSSATIRRAHAIHPVTAVQMEYSLISRGVEDDILPTLRELGVSLVAYGVLSRGLLTSHAPHPESVNDFRNQIPRFKAENLAQNQKLVDALEVLAQQKNVTPAQLAIAWVLSRGNDVLPLVGARKHEQLVDALSALEVTLSPTELLEIETVIPVDAVAGDRYPVHQMGLLDSEQKTNVMVSTTSK